MGTETTATVTLHFWKNPVASNGEGWAVATAPQPDRYKHIGIVQKERVAREGGLRQVFRPNPAPLRAVGFATLAATDVFTSFHARCMGR